MEDIDIFNNEFINPKGNAISIGRVDTIDVSYNTFRGSNVNGIFKAYVYMIYDKVLTVKNNIFYPSLSGGYVIEFASLDPSYVTIDYNLYFSDYPSVNMFQWNSIKYSVNTFATWKSTTGSDANSPDPADPLILGFTDMRVALGSPAIGVGVDLPLITTDKLGTARNDPPTIGAYEEGVDTTIVYISNDGDDNNLGYSTTAPLKTISAVNALTLEAGDQVLFNKGDTWSEKLVPPSSGSSGNPITLASYGT